MVIGLVCFFYFFISLVFGAAPTVNGPGPQLFPLYLFGGSFFTDIIWMSVANANINSRTNFFVEELLTTRDLREEEYKLVMFLTESSDSGSLVDNMFPPSHLFPNPTIQTTRLALKSK
eukprot:TRINITY_DN13803_c0_g1_i1.p2 TRINITY_DN13803_c0_g1~~TRINITY_DN13803_c0_g1_i1.p2  ORF type:complete len:118 (-),score=11.76 TRINITY_DN13803_c0_g1_i1:531-884(-)